MEANRAGCTLLMATNDVLEAERYCDRVALVSEGRVVAQGTPGELKAELRHDSVQLELRCAATDILEQVETFEGVGRARADAHALHVTMDDAQRFVTRAFAAFGDRITGVRIHSATLEDVYFQLVGRAIRPSGSGEHDD
jgi:ABC-2 type transport system ATP-binding protein